MKKKLPNLCLILSIASLSQPAIADDLVNQVNEPAKTMASHIAGKKDWIPQNKAGFFFTQSQDAHEYDASLKPTGLVDDYELTPIDIIAITRKKRPRDALDKDYTCGWANFVKVKHKGKEKVVFGGHVLYLTKQHKTKTLSLWETNDYYKGIADAKGLTGCDKFHTLLLEDSNGVYHAIEKNHPIESEPEEPQYINLVASDVVEDNIDFVTENFGTLSAKLTRTLQDETKSFYINIFPRNGDWWGDTSELKPSLYDKRTMSGISLTELENMALALYEKAGGHKRHPNKDLINDYITFTEAVIRDRADSINHSFSKLIYENAIKVATSSDNKLRFYSFNTKRGGSMQMYHTLYQSLYQTKDKNKGKTRATIKTTQVSHEVEGDGLYFVSKIHTLTSSEDTYYVVIANRIASSRDVTQTAMAYRIKNGELVPVKLFKTTKKSYAEIPISYNFFSAMDKYKNKYKQERPFPVIRYDKTKRQLLFTLVNDDGNVTDKSLVYQWTGDAFEYQGVE